MSSQTTLNITADHPDELRHAALTALGLPVTLDERFDALRRDMAKNGLQLKVTPFDHAAQTIPSQVPAPAPEPVQPGAALDKLANGDEWAQPAAPEQPSVPVMPRAPAPASEKPKRTRAKKDKPQDTAPAPAPVDSVRSMPANASRQTDIEDFTGDNEHRADLVDPLADGEPLPAAGAPAPEPVATTGKELDEALVLLQTAFARPGGPAKVKELQAKYGVTRFSHVPTEQHAALLVDAKACLKGLGG